MKVNVVDDYGWSSEVGPESCGYITPRILEIMKEVNVRHVLDIGSGNGRLCYELDRAGFAAVGVEYDKRGVEIAKKNYPSIPFYNYGVQDNPNLLLNEREPFDAVVSTEVIEHLFSPHLLLIYANSVLKQGGHLIITTPYHGYIKNLVLSLLNKWDTHHTPLWHGGHIKFWSRKTLTQLLHDHGFAKVEFSGVGRLPYLWKSMVLVARKS